jgi:hypothetical protein
VIESWWKWLKRGSKKTSAKYAKSAESLDKGGASLVSKESSPTLCELRRVNQAKCLEPC